MAQIFSTTIRSQEFNYLAGMILYFILEFFEPFKRFYLIPHQIDIAISAQVISKGNTENHLLRLSSLDHIHLYVLGLVTHLLSHFVQQREF